MSVVHSHSVVDEMAPTPKSIQLRVEYNFKLRLFFAKIA